MTVRLPDGTTVDLPDGATGAELAEQIGPGLARAALAVLVSKNGSPPELRDLGLPLEDGADVEIVTARSDEREEGGPLWLLRHDAAHVLATAVCELYPEVKVSIGPPIENGFYYDFEFPEGVSVSESDLPEIETLMQKHIDADESFERSELSTVSAIEHFQRDGQEYKVELIEDLVRDQGVESVSLYQNGPFTDLCRGPHGLSTGWIKAFKLTSVAGAYWRGDANRTMLTRIYGTAFLSKQALEQRLEQLAEARRRDHRKLGKELNLFMFSEFSPGSPLWLPAGTEIWNQLTKLWRRTNSEWGYREVRTPILYDTALWKQSGHWDVYRDHMYFTDLEGHPMGLKPMNCPAHIQIYQQGLRSYRDLPLRLAEQGLVHRHEPSGTLHGLLRVRHITQDDAHVFCRDDQVETEVLRCLELGFHIYEKFGFSPRLELSTRPEKRVGTDAMWDRSESALKSALERRELEYELNEGDGAFYGPKIDLHMTDSIGRSWQLGTVQLDYVMPERFGLAFVGEDNSEHQPVMIHRALMGSFERFIGILVEHYAGEFPLWLAPVQVVVLPISDRHLEYAERVAGELIAAGIRAEVDRRHESVGKKIRDAELRKLPYMAVVGDREQEQGMVSVRQHREGDQGSVALNKFLEVLRDAILATQ